MLKNVINTQTNYIVCTDGQKAAKYINHTIDYSDNTAHYDCNSYLNKNIEIFANIEQFTNLPSFESGALMCWFTSRGENLGHNDVQALYRNIQEALIVIWTEGVGWNVTKWRRFAIDTTVFSWTQVN